MKKIIPSLVIIILILLIVIGLIVWKMNSPKYSYDDVANLLLKGVESMNNMNNVTFEMKKPQIGAKYYYKENKMKMELMYSSDSEMSLTSNIINLNEGKQYTATPITIIRDITFGNVKDSDFELPTGDYIMYERDK